MSNPVLWKNITNLSSAGDNLHEMPNLVYGGNNYENPTNMLSAELAQRMVKVKVASKIVGDVILDFLVIFVEERMPDISCECFA